MYCHYCSRKFAEDANYCSHCGKPLIYRNEEEAAAAAELSQGWDESASSIDNKITSGDEDETFVYTANSSHIVLSSHPVHPSHQAQLIVDQRRSRGAWVLPVSLIALTLITAGLLLALYLYETDVNEHVLELQEQAQAAALAGEYEKSLHLLDEAVASRPNFTSLADDIWIVKHVMELHKQIELVDGYLLNEHLPQAEDELKRMRGQLKGRTEPVYAGVKVQTERLDSKMTVMKLSKELIDLTSFEELADMLSVVKGLVGADAEILAKQVVERIVEMNSKEAEILLKKKNYNGALVLTERALATVKDNEELIALLQRIVDEKSKYERTEQQRLEQAMQQAAEEDLINQTAAVEVVSIETTLDEEGALQVVGQMTNAATRPIYSVSVNFTVYDADGKEIGKGHADATPNYIEPGELINFTTTVYGVNVEGTTVVVDHATWYLD